MIQGKDLRDDGTVGTEHVFRSSAVRFGPEQKLRPNDVLLQSRGTTTFRAARVKNIVNNEKRSGLAGPEDSSVVAAAPLYIIRPHTALDPGFLVYYLNDSTTQAELISKAVGTALNQLRSDGLRSLIIPIPPLDRQRQIAEAARLIRRERKLSSQLAELRFTVLRAAAFEDVS